jgi:pilus assembly protein CpaF
VDNFFLEKEVCVNLAQRKGGLMNQTAKLLAQQARGRALLFGLPVEEAIVRGVAAGSENVSILQSELLRRPAVAEASGLGQIQNLIDDANVEEIWINRPDEVWIATSGVNKRLEVSLSSNEIESLVERMLRSTGRRIDRSTPFVDASLADGSRLHVVIPNVTREFWSLNIRKFRVGSATLEDLIKLQMLDLDQAQRLRRAVISGESILVSGATQAGKTTLLTAILNSISEGERLVTVEDTFEINCDVTDWVAMQTRDATPNNSGAVDMRRLVRESLRMRPSRIAVGEVRGAEALDLLLAFNSGIPGYCTIHANSAEHAIKKLASLPLLAGSNISSEFAKSMAVSSISLVAHCERNRSGGRRVVELREVSGAL